MPGGCKATAWFPHTQAKKHSNLKETLKKVQTTMLSIKPQNTFRTNNDSIIYLKLPNSRNKRIYGQLGGH